MYKSGGGGTGTSSSDVFATPNEEFSQSPTEHQEPKTVALILPYAGSTRTMPQKIVAFKVRHLEMVMLQRTYDLKIDVKLGAITLDQFRPSDGPEVILNVIQTPTYDSYADYLFTVNYTNVSECGLNIS